MTEKQATAAFHYRDLSPELILDAIESLAIYPETGLTPLNSYENRVYQFRCDRGQRYVVKFYRPERWTDAQIVEEHEFTFELAEAEIPIAAPVVLDGRSLHHFKEWRFALFPSIGGRSFEVDNLDQIEGAGQFIGRLHQYSRGSLFKQRLNLTPTTLGTPALEQLQRTELIPNALREHLLEAALSLFSELQRRWQGIEYQSMRLHGDLHPGNILWTPNGPGFVDLDDACNGPAVQDLWMMLSGDRQQQTLQLEVLLEAYEAFSNFDTKELQLIEPLRALRMLHYNAWLAKRWDDPAFPRHFPWFATEEYWQQQLQAFKEQQQRLDEPPLSLILY